MVQLPPLNHSYTEDNPIFQISTLFVHGTSSSFNSIAETLLRCLHKLLNMSSSLRHFASGYTWKKVTTPALVTMVFIMMMTMLSPPRYSYLFTNIREKHESKDRLGIPNKIWQIFSVPADFEGPEPFTLNPTVSQFCKKSHSNYWRSCSSDITYSHSPIRALGWL